MGFRDRLRERAEQGLKGILKRAIEYANEPVEPAPVQPQTAKEPVQPVQQTVKEPVQPVKEPVQPPPSRISPDLQDDSGRNNLLQALADSTTQSNEIVRRLEEMGYGNEAKDVVSASIGSSSSDDFRLISEATKLAIDQSQKALKMALDALKDSDNKLSDRAQDMLQRAEAMAESASQAARDAEDLASDMQVKAEEIDRKASILPEYRDLVEYAWQKDYVTIPYNSNLQNLWDVLTDTWFDLAVGIKRDEEGKPIDNSRHAPMLAARSNPLDPGRMVPPWALVNKTAFETWAMDNGYADGMALTIKGHYVGPSMSHLLRKNR